MNKLNITAIAAAIGFRATWGVAGARRPAAHPPPGSRHRLSASERAGAYQGHLESHYNPE